MATWNSSVVCTWMASDIPDTIRRPWQVWLEDLEEQEEEASQLGGPALSTVQAAWLHEARSTCLRNAFKAAPVQLQRSCAEVSFTELAAYVKWSQGQQTPAVQRIQQWNSLDTSDKRANIREKPIIFCSLCP